ncbi:recombinase A [Nodularia spumigena CS-584]|jgi:N-acetylneuraminic acid mutarotase|uniref:Uncharacterized protein n=2 Tax=Nodularia spumigena TaxID=70799 RepID=A0A2S0QAT8_NODSP|nr:hypothetical protein [Nodularia spumigena]AVZ31440.1 hypothetical protein BMF81_04167 [Nodularia spumigena UHCC 0039]EAW43682.1 recombinase A [Nodularia spumigena CCY9414]MDB9382601.1 recombinase A [Nodularia spumigena CS-584]MEA5526617.1 recombinase A [Nodularia spumigena UHCC 0143]MEA5559320.1 recombinase A [Nodularia spumigena CH309]
MLSKKEVLKSLIGKNVFIVVGAVGLLIYTIDRLDQKKYYESKDDFYCKLTQVGEDMFEQ